MSGRIFGRACLLVVLLLVAGRWIAGPADPMRTDVEHSLQGPRAAHLLGTDVIGRDVWARLAAGTVTSLSIALVAVALSSLVGLAVGCLAGVTGPRVDRTVAVGVDTLLAFPRFVLLLNLAAVFRLDSWWSLALLIGATSWMRTARLVRTEMLSLRERSFVEASRSAGAGALRRMSRHLAPQALALLLEIARLRVAAVVLAAASLNYLGIGLGSDVPTLGGLIRQGQGYLTEAPWIAASGIGVLGLTAVGLVLAGERGPEKTRRAAPGAFVPG